MSAGTKPYTFRLPDDLVVQMEETIKSRNLVSREEPWTWSGFVRDAIAAKLAHRARGRRQSQRKVFQTSPKVEVQLAAGSEGGES